MQLHQVLVKARQDQVNMVNRSMGECIRADIHVTNMPTIRILPKQKSKSGINTKQLLGQKLDYEQLAIKA